MKKFFLFSFLTICSATQFISAQEKVNPAKYTAHNKGKFFVSWGGNRENYSKSDVTFKGKDYNFTVDNMKAHDKPKGWHMDYINPTRMKFYYTSRISSTEAFID